MTNAGQRNDRALSAPGHAAVRDAGPAIVEAVNGRRIATARGLPRFAISLAFLAGVGLCLSGLLASHRDRDISIVSTTCGVLTILAALAAAVRPSPE